MRGLAKLVSALAGLFSLALTAPEVVASADKHLDVDEVATVISTIGLALIVASAVLAVVVNFAIFAVESRKHPGLVSDSDPTGPLYLGLCYLANLFVAGLIAALTGTPSPFVGDATFDRWYAAWIVVEVLGVAAYFAIPLWRSHHEARYECCRWCNEWTNRQARKCRHCGSLTEHGEREVGERTGQASRVL
jgi:hypothetical protein